MGFILLFPVPYRCSTPGRKRRVDQGPVAGKYARREGSKRPETQGSGGRPRDLACPPPSALFRLPGRFPPGALPSGPPASPAPRSHSRCQPHRFHMRRACAEPSPSVAPLSKSSESFASQHLTLSLTMERVGPQLRKA